MIAEQLLTQDMGLAIGVGETVGTPLPLGKAAERIYAEVVEGEPELAGKDFSSVYTYLSKGGGSQ